MNDCIKSCRLQRIAVFDLSGEEDDGDSGRVAARGLQHAERDLAGQSLPVGLAFARDDETAFPHTVCEMDGLQDRPDARMHFGTQADRERGADAAGRTGARHLVRIDSVLRFPGFCLSAEPPFQRNDTLLVRPFLRAENGRCPGGAGEVDIRIVEGMDPDAFGKGSKGLKKTGAAVHDRRSA